MKNIDLIEVPESQKSVLQQLIELYEYDLSLFTGYELNEHGYYGYSYLDYYWTQKNRFAYFITVEGKIAGFVLVNDYCEVTEDPDARTIAEFFVMKAYRRKGIGKRVAERVFDMFRGTWEIHQYLENKESLYFWENVVGDYMPQGNFEKKVAITEDGEQQVILFNNTNQNNNRSR